MPTSNEVLKRYWGFDRLYPSQEQAIGHLLDKKDVIALLPTGGGKSACFQIPALMRPGICIVISPLISLMQDQVNTLKKKGVKAMTISGSIPMDELSILLDNCIYGNYKFLYLSPERLQNELVQERIRQMNINLIAVDEAHCISEWGHDFRPAYREITVLKELRPEVNFIALTATATQRVLEDIGKNLELEDAEVVSISFARNNIALLIKKNENKNFELQKFLRKNPGVSIVYVRTRKMTTDLRDFLKSHNISAEAYHGGLNTDQRGKLLHNWQGERFEVMVATTAFGMGIDKSNVRNVVHYHLPDSLENYYQEVGRAGRDGLASKAFLTYGNDDILKLKNQFLANAPTPERVKLVYKKLNAYFSIAYGEGQETDYNFNFLDFCNTYGFNTYMTYNVLQFLDRLDILSLSKEFKQRTELFFKIPHQELYAFLNENRAYRDFVQALLRMQGGFFDYSTTVDLKMLQNKTGLNRKKINAELKKLADLDVIDLSLADQDSTVVFLVPREDDHTINPIIPFIDQYYQSKKEKVDRMVRFVENDETCKVVQLLAYFGEAKTEDCGHCSVCVGKSGRSKTSKDELAKIRETIVSLLEKGESNSKQLSAKLDYPEERVLSVIRTMLDKNEIKLTKRNTYCLKNH